MGRWRRLGGRSLLVLLAALVDPTATALAQQASPLGLDVTIVRDERRDGRRLIILKDDFFYCYPPTDELFIVPAYFESDFASIPGFAQSFINPFGDHAEAAIVHDWLYAVGEPDGRAKADDIFRFAMMEQGVGVVTRNTMHRAVRAGGGGAYGRPEEWRFVDPLTRQPVAQAPARPARAAVGRTECDTFDADIRALRAQYADVYAPRTRPGD